MGLDDKTSEANRIRVVRGAARKRWIECPPDVAFDEAQQIVEHPPEWARGWRVGKFLRTLPHVGLERSARMLRACRIRDDQRLGSLTEHQRELLSRQVMQRQELRRLRHPRVYASPSYAAGVKFVVGDGHRVHLPGGPGTTLCGIHYANRETFPAPEWADDCLRCLRLELDGKS